jgi:hypothetical protein
MPSENENSPEIVQPKRSWDTYIIIVISLICFALYVGLSVYTIANGGSAAYELGRMFWPSLLLYVVLKRINSSTNKFGLVITFVMALLLTGVAIQDWQENFANHRLSKTLQSIGEDQIATIENMAGLTPNNGTDKNSQKFITTPLPKNPSINSKKEKIEWLTNFVGETRRRNKINEKKFSDASLEIQTFLLPENLVTLDGINEGRRLLTIKDLALEEYITSSNKELKWQDDELSKAMDKKTINEVLKGRAESMRDSEEARILHRKHSALLKKLFNLMEQELIKGTVGIRDEQIIIQSQESLDKFNMIIEELTKIGERFAEMVEIQIQEKEETILDAKKLELY